VPDFVELQARSNRGYPWPGNQFTLTPMFGEDGWCHSCGVPKGPQTGSMILMGSGMTGTKGAWSPNWMFNTVLDRSVADQVRDRFQVELREVHWPGRAPDGSTWQIIEPTVGPAWWPEKVLRDRAITQHGVDGAACGDCGVWRWMPLFMEELPLPRVDLASLDGDVAASPEWFGDGRVAFHQILMRRELAELIIGASPRRWRLQEVFG
jgi:hypothetical protein